MKDVSLFGKTHHLCFICERCKEWWDTTIDLNDCPVAAAARSMGWADADGWSALFGETIKQHGGGNDICIEDSQDVIFATKDNGAGYYITNCAGYRFDRNAYKDYLRSEKWQEKRKERLLQDGYRCQLCGTGKNLEVHHVTYERIGNEKISDLVTLCNNCHQFVHKKDLMKKEEKND